VAHASQVLADLAAGKYSVVEGQFDPTLKSGLSLSTLRLDWLAYQRHLGAYRRHAAPEQDRDGPVMVERVPVTMTRGKGTVRVSFDQDGQIAGLSFINGSPPPSQVDD
jgi:Protein of unknown function (DUF3887)